MENCWALTLTRKGAAGGYGAYKAVFTNQGFDAVNSDIRAKVSPMQQ